MTGKMLREKGILIDSYDLRDGLYTDVYDGTCEIYYYDNALYSITSYQNRLHYNGSTKPLVVQICDDLKKDIEKYNFLYWKQYVSKEAYENLIRIASAEDKRSESISSQQPKELLDLTDKNNSRK